MEKMFHWYEDGEPKGRLSSNKFKSLPTQPFARPQVRQTFTLLFLLVFPICLYLVVIISFS